MQCNNLNTITAKGIDQLKITYASSQDVVKMFLLSAVVGRPSSELHLTFHIGKDRSKDLLQFGVTHLPKYRETGRE